MQRTHRVFLASLLAVAALAFGCAPVSYVSTPQPVDSIAQYTALEVAPIKANEESWDNANEEELAYIREEFVKYLTKKKVMPQVAEAVEGTQEVLLMDCEIVQFDKGSAAARFFIGFGAGAAKMVLHLRLVDKGTGALIAETDITNTQAGGLSASPKKMAKAMSGSVAKFIKKRGQGGRTPTKTGSEW